MVEFKNNGIVSDTEDPFPKKIPNGWYYTAKEFAEIMDIPVSTIRVWKKRGILDCISYYGRLYVDPKAQIKLKRGVTEERKF